MTIQSNLQKVRAHIATLSSNPVTLVAVSKIKPVSDLKVAYDSGQRHFGENYVAELVDKSINLPSDVRWHMIGHLQSNKVNKLISGCSNLFMIETVDSVKLANKIELAMRTARPTDKLKVLIEVKTSPEESKDGIEESTVPALVAHIREYCPHLEFSGLMTIADPKNPAESFRKMNELKARLGTQGITVETLSMGMSSDYEQAIAFGSNHVRIGSVIFGSR
jgi:pyridoxal phosphate enzyme (YggS family)